MVETAFQKTDASEIAIRTEPVSGIGTRLDEAAKKLKEEKSYSLVLGDSDLEGLIQDVMLPILKDQENRGIRVDVKHVSVSIEERKIGLIAGVKKKLGPIWPPELGINAELELENIQQDTHEGIQTTKLQVNPPTFMGLNIFEEVNSFLGGDKINSTFRGYLTEQMQERGVNIGDVGLRLTEDNHLKIELSVPRAEVVSPEQIEVIPPEETLRPAEVKPEKKPEIITVVAKKPTVPPESQELTSLGKLRQEIKDNRQQLREGFDEFTAGEQTGEQLEATLDQFTSSLFALNAYLNSQVNPESIPPGLSKEADKYLSSNAFLEDLRRELSKKDSPFRARYDMALRYSERLLGKGGRKGGGRLSFFRRLQGKTPSPAAAEVEEKASAESTKSEQPAPSWVKPKARYVEFVKSINPKTGKGGFLLYFLEAGQLKLQSVDEGGGGAGDEFVVNSNVASSGEAISSIQADVKKYEEKGLQITRNVPLEVFEEVRRREFQELENKLKEARGSFYKAVDNYEDARLNYLQAKHSPRKGRSSVWAPGGQYRIEESYWKPLKTATRERRESVNAFEKPLLAFNSYLDRNIGMQALDGDEDLVERYHQMGKELEELSQRESRAAKTRQRVDLLGEYDRLFNARLAVYIQITKQRGLNLSPEVKSEGSFVNPRGEFSEVQTQEIVPAITAKGEDGGLVGVSFSSPGGRAFSTSSLGELKGKLPTGGESAPSRVLEKWRVLKDKGVPVAPWIWGSSQDGKILTADLSKGGKLEVADFDLLALHLKNFAGETNSLPAWLINHRQEVRDELERLAETASGLRFEVPASSYRLVVDRKGGPPAVFLGELGQVVERDRLSEQEVFRQNLDLISDVLVGKLKLFNKQEWDRWLYERSQPSRLRKAA